MPETKKCPNCGETILAVAKKCKYCGTWIEPKKEFRCPVCCEVIPEDSEVCPVCHERLKVEPAQSTVEETSPTINQMGQESLRENATEMTHSSLKKHALVKKNKWLFIIVAAVLALSIAVFFIIKPKTNVDRFLDGIQEELPIDEDGTSVSPAGTWYSMTGYITSDSGKKYDIDMELTVSFVGSEEEGFSTEGSYHYASQSENNRISLSGTKLSGQYGLSQILLYSAGGTERFVLALDSSNREMDGYWFQYDDIDSCMADSDNYSKRFAVTLKY